MRSAASVLLVVLTGATARAAMTPEQLLELPVALGSTRVAYGTDPLQFGELRVPSGAGPHPVAVLVHGGCWAARLPGRDPRITTYELLRPLAAALSRAGVATWNVEYRRAGNPGGGWPGTFLDLASAVDFLPRAPGSERLDLGCIVVVGHSSGGQVALWLAARAKVPHASPIAAPAKVRIRAAIDVDGPPDLLEAQPLEREFCPVPGVTDFLGGSPASHPERYRDGSANSFLPLGVPHVLVKAELLASAPGLLHHYVERARSAGDVVTVVDLPGADHFEMMDPGGPHGQRLLEVIVRAAGSPRSLPARFEPPQGTPVP